MNKRAGWALDLLTSDAIENPNSSLGRGSPCNRPEPDKAALGGTTQLQDSSEQEGHKAKHSSRKPMVEGQMSEFVEIPKLFICICMQDGVRGSKQIVVNTRVVEMVTVLFLQQ